MTFRKTQIVFVALIVSPINCLGATKARCARLASSLAYSIVVGENGMIRMTFEGDGANVKIKEAPGDLKSNQSSNLQEFSSESLRKKFTFRKIDGFIRSVEVSSGGRLENKYQISEDCALTQITDGSDTVTYDDPTCKAIGEALKQNGFDLTDADKCSRVEIAIQNVLMRRARTLSSEGKKSDFAVSTNDSSKVIPKTFACAEQYVVQNRENGMVSKSVDFSKEWLRDAFSQKPSGGNQKTSNEQKSVQ